MEGFLEEVLSKQRLEEWEGVNQAVGGRRKGKGLARLAGGEGKDSRQREASEVGKTKARFERDRCRS